MRHMCHAILASRHYAEQLDDCVTYYKPLCLDGDGKWKDEDFLLGKGVAEAQQNAVDGSRCTYRWTQGGIVDDARRGKPKLAKLHKFLHHSGADAAGQIENKEALAAQHLLHHAAEHPQGEHVEEDVLDVCVHEHVGYQLIEVEVLAQTEIQSKI